ncbi:hypothetical protein, partial [Burkholderia multivorans]|uniref:hypothetical protein n=1 Tax=Burkholderia multivorans TaxID=87883 RepID=UPI001C654CB0
MHDDEKTAQPVVERRPFARDHRLIAGRQLRGDRRRQIVGERGAGQRGEKRKQQAKRSHGGGRAGRRTTGTDAERGRRGARGRARR